MAQNKYCYDSAQVAKIADIILQNDMLNGINKEQASQVELLKANEVLLKGKAIELQAIINLKDEQIKKLEGIKIPVVTVNNKDWIYFMAGGVVIGAVISYFIYKGIAK